MSISILKFLLRYSNREERRKSTQNWVPCGFYPKVNLSSRRKHNALNRLHGLALFWTITDIKYPTSGVGLGTIEVASI